LKKRIYTQTRNFRVTSALNEQIRALADKAHLQDSTIIRDAVAAYVTFYRDNPEKLRRMA